LGEGAGVFDRFAKAITLGAFSLSAPAAVAGPVEDLDAWLALPRASRPALESQAFADVPLTAAECARARDRIWAERLAFVKAAGAAEWSGKTLVNAEGLRMPFDYRIYGAKPAAGYDLYISMHGGGETDKATNDGQWRNQILLYHPRGIYLAPRAPTDAWNMWHKDHIDGFFDRLIQLCVANLGANPNRVYVMGYSAGGDGTYQMAPRMADRWAAAAMMAGYPNNASPINLRGVGFTMHVGALDAAYGRNTICVEFGKAMQKLQDADPGFYKYDVQVHAGKGHWMDQEDTVALAWTYAFTRQPNPKRVDWLQDTTVGTNSFPAGGPVKPVPGHPTQWRTYWLGLAAKAGGPKQARLSAEIKGQEVSISEANVDSLVISLNDSLVDLDRSVRVTWKGKTAFAGILPRTIGNLYRSADERGDREYVYPAAVKVRASGASAVKPPVARHGNASVISLEGASVWSAPRPGRSEAVDAAGRLILH
jgi:acetyl esterase/lipase